MTICFCFYSLKYLNSIENVYIIIGTTLMFSTSTFSYTETVGERKTDYNMRCDVVLNFYVFVMFSGKIYAR